MEDQEALTGEDPQTQEVMIDQFELENFKRKLMAEQSLGGGLIGGFLGMAVGALLWAIITYVTEYQVGLVAIGVGFLAGLGVRILGKGFDTVFGIIGALMALFGVILGNYLTILLVVMAEFELSAAEVISLGLNFPLIIETVIETFNLMDLLFYGLAIYAGYRASFRRITEEEIRALQPHQP